MDTVANRTLRTADDLVTAELVSRDAAGALSAVAERYATAIPPAILELIHTAASRVAITRQFVPAVEELFTTPDELTDPIGDQIHSPVKGIVHRYPDRALLMPTLVCPVYCRFCFRREIVGPDGGALNAAQLAEALNYIQRTPEIWEVILTGGDPLILSTRRISEILTALDEITHVKIVRVHTRVPIATPQRIDADLVAAMASISKPVYAVLHCNHADELTADVANACARFVNSGIPLLSQTVLLRNVNDSIDALEALMRALVALRIKPYYLHQLDFAPGTSHFRVPLEEGQALVKELRGRLSGLAQPTYMLDIPGGAGKVPLTPTHTSKSDVGFISVESPDGQIHPYPPPVRH